MLERSIDDIRQDLYSGDGILLWIGCGYVGLSAMLTYASEGVSVWGFDADPKVREQITAAICPVPGLEEWVEVRLENVKRFITAAESLAEIPWDRVRAIFVAVNTERDGKPWLEPLASVASSLRPIGREREPEHDLPIVIIESTIPVTALTEIDLSPFPVVVSPRRDWFVAKDMNLRTLTRVYGADSAESGRVAVAILGMVTKQLQRASSTRIAALVKPVENAYQHAQMMWWSELSLAYPDIDVDELAELAGGHWRIKHKWWPGLVGTGGYCVPVAGKYLLEGSSLSERLGLVRQAARVDDELRAVAAGRLSGCRRVLIMGAAYKGGLHVIALSPGLDIAKILIEEFGVSIAVCDPHVNALEVAAKTGASMITIEEIAQGGFDGVLVTTDHPEFKRLSAADIIAVFAGSPGPRVILDEHALWEKHAHALGAAGIEYVRRGLWEPTAAKLALAPG